VVRRLLGRIERHNHEQFYCTKERKSQYYWHAQARSDYCALRWEQTLHVAFRRMTTLMVRAPPGAMLRLTEMEDAFMADVVIA
jgi:hypothetical protein